MSDSLSPPPPAGAGHDHRSSFLSFDDVSEEARASFAQQDDDEEQEVTSPRPTRQVTVQWNGAGQDVQLYASHNRFQEPIELTGDAENGRSAQVDAPIGQDLLYRFLVDGEWETATDAPVMAQDGAEYNTMHVAGAEETASLSSSAQANSVKFAMPEDDDDGNERRPHPAKRRQSSIHWDNQRGKLVISESSEASDPVVGTPIKPSSTRNSQPVTPKLTGLSSGSPRFVSLGAGAAVPGPIAVGSPEDEDGDSGSDEEETDPAAPEEGSARTKRKNRAHRLKSKQTRALFQSPEKSNLNQSAPAFLTPMNGGQPPASQARSPGAPMGGPVSAQLQALQMVHMQRENEWKQNWIAHEIQSFQAREEERKQLKTVMNEERARWLAKLKEYTGELKQLRDDNLQLKTELAASASNKRLESSSKARADKFATLSKNMLNDEMLTWIREKGQLTSEIANLKDAREETNQKVESLNTAVQTAQAEATALKIAVAGAQRDVQALTNERDALRSQLSAAAGSGSQASEALVKAEEKLAEEVRAANALRGQLQTAEAELQSVKADLGTRVADLTAKLDATLKSTEEKQAEYKKEIVQLQQKGFMAQDDLLSKQAELDAAQEDKQAAEAALGVQAAQFAAKTAALELEVAASRSASKDQEIKVLNLHAVTKALRADLAELSEVVLHNTATFTQQLAESQSFMTQALSVQTNLLQSTMSKYKKEMSERRKLHNLVQELRGNIRVYARARPLSETESTTGGATYAVTVPQPDVEGEPSTELLLESSKGKTVPYQFDAVFGPESTQQQVFAQIVSLVTSVLDGYNVCLFAYGQTGAGKTHTMAGTPKDPGMNLRSLSELFRLRQERAEDFSYKITASFYEIYNEQLFDLLDSHVGKELKIRQSPTGGVYVENLSERVVEKEEDVLQMMQEGNKNRSTAGTAMNAQSSRSHSILSVSVHGHSSVTGNTYLGRLNLIDLAGSERISRSQATGDRLKEAQAINLSLSSLGDVISALGKKSSHIPYRNSKLTHVLSSSLGGNSKCLMVVNVSPSSLDVDESNCSLTFAARVRSVELGAASKNQTSNAGPSEGGAAAGAASSAAAGATPVKRPASAAVKASPDAKARPAVGAAAGAAKKPLAAAPGSATKKPAAK